MHTGRTFVASKAANQGPGSEGMLPQKIFKFRVSENYTISSVFSRTFSVN